MKQEIISSVDIPFLDHLGVADMKGQSVELIGDILFLA